VIPASFADSLQLSLDTVGGKLSQYRNCIMHDVTLRDANATCRMTRFDGRWGATVPLTTNPKSRRRAAFDNVLGDGIDALGYCHGVAVHIVGVCEGLMALPAVASHIVRPPSDHSGSSPGETPIGSDRTPLRHGAGDWQRVSGSMRQTCVVEFGVRKRSQPPERPGVRCSAIRTPIPRSGVSMPSHPARVCA
jgi:hypothetical protein